MKGVALTYLDPSGRRPEGALDLGSDCRAEPFRFLYLGDEQNSLKSLCSRSFRRAYAAAADGWFLVHAGDLVQDGFDDHLWGEWSEALGFISTSVPGIPVPGNHDLHRPKGYIGHSEVIHSLICRRTARRCQPDSPETGFWEVVPGLPPGDCRSAQLWPDDAPLGSCAKTAKLRANGLIADSIQAALRGGAPG